MSKKADVCLILEGTYPYVAGGVSTWTHELISRQSHLTFHILSILPKGEDVEMKYELPSNVVGITKVFLQELPHSVTRVSRSMEGVETALNNITTATAHSGDLKDVINFLNQYNGRPGEGQLIDSEASWELLVDMYDKSFPESSFLDYFWSWRSIAGSLFSILLADLPEAGVYHALSTGYAGLLGARAKLETGRPLLITEHGIYTNERRIEIASADWLEEAIVRSLTVDKTKRSLRDLWIDTFTNYSRIAYETADEIITLYQGNQVAQLSDGADADKMHIIRNGVDVDRYGAIKPVSHERPTIALIGRVVPIKDIKSFIRTCSIMREEFPDLLAYIMGPTDEDSEYYEECMEMVEYLSLKDTVVFTDRVKIDDYIPKIDVIVITSISEAQPLVILEAGAAGIPCVSTNVGACSEMILGHEDEDQDIGDGGAIVPLSNPAATADALFKLLTDREHYELCSKAIRQRVKKYYHKDDQHSAYSGIYDRYVNSNSRNAA